MSFGSYHIFFRKLRESTVFFRNSHIHRSPDHFYCFWKMNLLLFFFVAMFPCLFFFFSSTWNLFKTTWLCHQGYCRGTGIRRPLSPIHHTSFEHPDHLFLSKIWFLNFVTYFWFSSHGVNISKLLPQFLNQGNQTFVECSLQVPPWKIIVRFLKS